MIGAFWLSLKQALILEGGYDRLVSFLEDELSSARLERAQDQTKQRMSPAYDGHQERPSA